jgi:hypothetical protein
VNVYPTKMTEIFGFLGSHSNKVWTDASIIHYLSTNSFRLYFEDFVIYLILCYREYSFKSEDLTGTPNAKYHKGV